MTIDISESLAEYAEYAPLQGRSFDPNSDEPVEDNVGGLDGLQSEGNQSRLLDEYIPYDYSDKYFKGTQNRHPHYDTPFTTLPQIINNHTTLVGKGIISNRSNEENGEYISGTGKLTKDELRTLYANWKENSALFQTIFDRLANKLYKLVLKECTYVHRGNRLYVSGGTDIMNETLSSYIRFVEAYERGRLEMYHF